MRVFVTGASGFIGSAVVSELIAAGHDVLGLARSDASAQAVEAAGARVHRGDLENLESLRAGAQAADGVIHLTFNHDFTQYTGAVETDRRAIDTLGEVLAGSDRPFVVTSGLASFALGRTMTEDDAVDPDSPRASEQAALAFMRSLSPTQRETAGVQPLEHQHVNEGRIQGGALRDNLLLPYEGLSAAVLAPRQQAQLLELIEVYVGRMQTGHDRVRMAEVQQQLDRTHVAWTGDVDDDSTFYYRIHSPVLLIEFDHLRGIALDNDAPARTHIHTVMRTPNGNDYGKDLLRQHYARFPH